MDACQAESRSGRTNAHPGANTTRKLRSFPKIEDSRSRGEIPETGDRENRHPFGFRILSVNVFGSFSDEAVSRRALAHLVLSRALSFSLILHLSRSFGLRPFPSLDPAADISTDARLCLVTGSLNQSIDSSAALSRPDVVTGAASDSFLEGNECNVLPAAASCHPLGFEPTAQARLLIYQTLDVPEWEQRRSSSRR